MSDKAPAIGIDLGTTFTCLSVYRFGKVEIIANNFGNRITPSVVAFNENERLIGDAAKQQAHSNYANTVFDSKRLMGCKFDDAVVQEDIKHWPFTIINEGGTPKYQVTFKGELVVYSPEEISAMVLGEMKLTASLYLGKPVHSAVITVPSYFNGLQRKATIDAAEIAGLKVLRLINEPTAAAVAYGFCNVHEGSRNVLVFDLGGGTFDVTVLNIHKNYFDVLSTGGNTHLGGEDFDRRLVDHCIKDVLRKHKIDISSNKRAMEKLRKACELAKRTLSTQTVAYIDSELLVDGIDYKATISRAKFEDLNADLFQSTLNILQSTLEDSNLTKCQIEEVVLVGGSTRIPKIIDIVSGFFGRSPTKSINPDEAVAYGAAIVAAIVNGDQSIEITNTILSDIIPLTLGIKVVLPLTMNKMINRNTKIPATYTRGFTTVKDNQTTIVCDVFQGESDIADNNYFLGDFRVTEIPSALAEVETVDVTFDIDCNGVLEVTAVLKSTGKQMKVIIETKGILTKQEIDFMVKNEKRLNLQDSSRREINKAKNDLEVFCLEMKAKLGTLKLAASILDLVLKSCNETLDWMGVNSAEKTEYEERLEKIRTLCDRHIPKAISDVD